MQRQFLSALSISGGRIVGIWPILQHTTTIQVCLRNFVKKSSAGYQIMMNLLGTYDIIKTYDDVPLP